MKFRNLTIQTGLYTAAFLLALGLRFAALGQSPLSDSEASLALQALHLTQGSPEPLGPQAGYAMLTGLWMFLFGSYDWVARFWPALAGSLFVLLPWLFREKIGRGAALVLAFWAAVDPGLVASSREAGGSMIAVCAVYAALGFFLARRPVFTGIAAGLALLGGVSVWPGLLGFALVGWLFYKKQIATPQTFDWRLALLSGAATWVLVGSMVFLFPAGLGAAASAVPLYLKGWAQPSGVPLGRMFSGLIVYLGPGLVIGLIGLGRAFLRKEAFDQQLAAWVGIAFLLAVVYPNRQVSDLLWVIPPLLTMAARQVARQWEIGSEDRLPMMGQALLTAIMIFFAWAAGSNMAASGLESTPMLLQWGRVAAALVLLGVTTFLVAWGWSLASARTGLQWGVTIVLAFYMLSTTFNSAGLSSRVKAELWPADPPFAGRDLLEITLRNFDEWQPLLATQLDIVVVDVTSPALKWALHHREAVSYVSGLPAGASPALVITSKESQMAQSAAYRGQDFVIWRRPAWDIMLGKEWFNWMIYRTAPQDESSMILWVRTDLFPGGDEQQSQPLPDESIQSQ